MNVGVLAYTFYENDGRVMRYAKAIVQNGGKVEVFALKKPGQIDYEIVEGVDVYRIQTRHMDERTQSYCYLYRLLKFFVLSLIRLSWRHLTKARYDVVHIHSVPDFEVFAAVICKITGAKIILDIHDIVPEFYIEKFGGSKKSSLFKVLCVIEKLSIWFADHVIIANDIWKDRLISRSCPAEKLTSFVNYPDEDYFFPRKGVVKHNNISLVYPGTLNYHQGIDLLIKAVNLLREEYPDLNLLVYGTGPSNYRESLEELVDNLDLRGNVTFNEPLPMMDLVEAISRCHVGVVPKRGDGFGNEAFSTKIPEMMALGIPVVIPATDIDRYYFNESVAEFFIPGDEESLAAAVRKLLEDPDRRNQIREKALLFVQEMLWKTKKREYLSLLK